MSNPCPILLINLDSSRDRLNSALVKLKEAGLSAERISAVDGRLLTEEERKLITIWDKSAFFKPLSPGEIGCYLSHIAAAEHIVKEGWPMAVVLEDDFKLHPDFKKHLTEIINFSNQLPDMVKLEGGLKGKEAVLKLTPEVSLVRYRRPPANTLAHLWTLAGAKKFLSIARPLRRPIDVQLKHWWEGDLNILTTFPELVIHDDKQSSVSTIGVRRPVGFVGKLRQYSYRLKYAIVSQWKLLCRYGWRTSWRTSWRIH